MDEYPRGGTRCTGDSPLHGVGSFAVIHRLSVPCSQRAYIDPETAGEPVGSMCDEEDRHAGVRSDPQTLRAS